MLLMASLMLLPSLAFAQNSRKVSGHVADESGIPLAGVYVLVKGTTVGTSTDNDGNFSLSIPAQTKTLEFSLLGMKTQEVPVGTTSKFDIKMATGSLGLDETVVIGYGSIIKRDLSSSVATVKSEALNERASAINVMQSLSGKVAGVRSVSFSGRPGGTSTLRVRGMGSINAGNDPIYVMDGVVGVDPNSINSADIESIEVLKDAAATAMYGSQGANGVILITTKSGKAGKGSVTYDSRVGFSYVSRKMDMLNADEFMEVQRRAYAYGGNTMPHLTTPIEKLFYYQKDAAGNYVYDSNGLLIASPKYDTDWQDEVMQKAKLNYQTLSFSQGTDKTQVYASLAYQDVDGLMRYTYAKRYSGTINVHSQINDWVSVQAIANVGSTDENKGDSEGAFNQGALRNTMEMLPIVPMQYEDGTWGRKNDYPLGELAENPLNLLKNRKVLYKSDYQFFNVAANANITKDLVLTVQGGYHTINSKNVTYAKAGLLDYTANNGGSADIANTDTRNFSNEDYLTYNKSFFDKKLKSTFVLGASWYYSRTENSSSGSEQYFDDSFEYYNLGAGTVYHKPSSGMVQSTMNSYYFRMNHNFLNKYMLGVTFRADGASNFGENNKYGFFPSASAAWIISEEPFFANLKEYVGNLKLRASYGAVGNASIPSYRTFSQYSTGSNIFNNTLTSYVTLANLGNKDLKWETTKQFNVGLDFSLLKDKIQVISDFYVKNTSDLLYEKQVPYTTGYSTSWTNIGLIRNTGFELTVNTHNIDKKDFTWDTDIIFSTNRTKVIDLGGEILNIGTDTRAEEGKTWGTYYIYHLLGTWGLDEVAEAARYGCKPGDKKYEDRDNNGIINDNDKVYYGTGTPKGEISMTNTFNYKGFSLMVDLDCRYGFKIMNITKSMFMNQYIYSNSVGDVLDAWTPEHQNTMVPALRLPSDKNWGIVTRDTYMFEKGDFLRVKNIMLSYDFKRTLLKNFKYVKGLVFGVAIENPYVLTAYSGYDPEVGWMNFDTLSSVDFYSYPKPTTVTGNLKITF